MEIHTLFNPVWAYFDPGMGSLALQAIVGGTAGLLVFAKYLWNTAAPSMFQTRQTRPEASPSSYEIVTTQSS